MLLESNEEHDNHQILLYDGHQEYSGAMTDLPYHNPDPDDSISRYQDTLRTAVIWDPYTIEDITGYLLGRESLNDPDVEGRITQSFDQLFPGLVEKYQAEGATYGAGDWGAWMVVSGSRKGLRRAFLALADACSGTPGGDDDVYDYWPSAMDMMFQFARDLDKIFHYGAPMALERAFEVYDAVALEFDDMDDIMVRPSERR